MCGGMVKKSTLGFIGSGRIGLSILKRLQAFEPEKILYHSRNHSQKFDSNGAIYSSFEELLTKSDIIIVICSLNPSTRNLLGAKQFAIMKKNAVVINTSRGAVIDQKALYEALKNKQIGAAGLDVFETEPIPLDDPLLELDNAGKCHWEVNWPYRYWMLKVTSVWLTGMCTAYLVMFREFPLVCEWMRA